MFVAYERLGFILSSTGDWQRRSIAILEMLAKTEALCALDPTSLDYPVETRRRLWIMVVAIRFGS